MQVSKRPGSIEKSAVSFTCIWAANRGLEHVDSFVGTFRRSIEFGTLAKQLTDAFYGVGHGTRRILRKNNGFYLSYRVEAENGAYGFLPGFIKKIRDVACSGLDCGEQSRRKNTRTLCYAVVQRFRKNINTLLEWSSDTKGFIVSKFSKDDTNTHVAAATAFGNLHALRTALRHEKGHMWNESIVFGRPIVLAATGGHFQVVRAIVKDFEKTHYETQDHKWTDQFSAAIDIAFRNLHLDIVLLLLRIYDAYGPAIDLLQAERWSEYAMPTGNVDVIDQTQRFRRNSRSPSSTRTEAAEFRHACEDNNLTTVRMLIEEGRVSLSCILSKAVPDHPIYQAVLSRNAEAVKLVLDMGFDPDIGLNSSLSLAIHNVDHDIIQLLLQYGANPEEKLEHWNLRQGRSRDIDAIESMLLEAKEKHQYYIRSTGPRTNLTLDAEDLVSTD
jgi:hypothetical protein